MLEKNIGEKIIVYTDGSVGPRNPGQGGWGCILIHQLGKCEICGYGGNRVTNNQMELAAMENGLRLIKNDYKHLPIYLYTDSQWAMNSVNGTYKKLKKNVEIVRRIQRYIKDNNLDIRWKFIRGHGKDKLIKASASGFNERCDELANRGRLFGSNRWEKNYFPI